MRPELTDLLPSSIERQGADLAVVLGLVLATVFATLLDGPTVVRVPLALCTVLVLPGYTIVAALFPAGTTTLSSDSDDAASTPTGGITLLERAVLSVGLSLAVVPVVGIAVDDVIGTIAAETLLGGVALVTLGALPIAAVRRARTPASIRYAPGAGFGERQETPSYRRGPDLLTAVLVLSVVFAGGAVAYSETVATDESDLTEFYVLAPDENGTLGATDYPTDLTPGDPGSLALAVGNGEEERVTYTIVGQLQQIERSGNLTVVEDRREITRREVTVTAGETATLDETVVPTTTGTHRVVYLLYRGDPPANPTTENAYREVHLWVDVTESTAP